MPYGIRVVFHSGPSYDNPFVMKKLANDFEGQFESLGGKYRKIQNFFYSNTIRVTTINKDGDQSVLTISYKLKFIDSA